LPLAKLPGNKAFRFPAGRRQGNFRSAALIQVKIAELPLISGGQVTNAK
jgi:hypothetical protein